MALDPSIPLQTNTGGPPMGTLASLLSLKNQQQQVQAGAMANQQAQIDLQERQGIQGIMGNIKAYQDSAGNIDFNRFVPAVMSVAPTTGASVVSNVAQAQTAATNAHAQVNALDAASRKTVGDALYSLKGQSPDVVSNTLQGLKQAYPGIGGAVDYFGKYILAPHAGDPDKLDAALDQAGKFVQTAPTNQAMATPEGPTIDDGATTRMISTKPGTGVPVGQVVPGTQATKQLPPTTPTVLPNGQPGVIGPHSSVDMSSAPMPGSGAPADFSGIQGPQRMAILRDIARNSADPDVRAQAGQAVLAMSQPQQQAAPGGQPFQASQPQGVQSPGSGFTPTGLPLGAAEGITGPVAVANQHFAQVQADASLAPNRIAALQTIKQQIPNAIMSGGRTGDFLRGVSRTFGLINSSDATTANDVMAKNLAVLAAQGGNTDAARTLGEMGNPSYHMTADAAQRAVDQLVGIEAKKQAAAAYFSGTPTNTPAYANKMQMWNRYGDPRAFEFAAKSPSEQDAMRAEMKRAGTWTTLKNNMEHLDAMGVPPQ